MYDFHIHSSYSDGSMSVMKIAKRAKEKGLKAIAIVDHSTEHRFGLTERKALQRQREIEEAMDRYDIEILSGVECGIGAEGEILLPAVKFDIIIASIHDLVYGDEYYRRVELCLKNCEFDVLGHFQSTIFSMNNGWREEKDMEIIDLLVENDVAVELNSYHACPTTEFLLRASSRKLRYSFGSDAHTADRIGDIGWCIKASRYLRRGRFVLEKMHNINS